MYTGKAKSAGDWLVHGSVSVGFVMSAYKRISLMQQKLGIFSAMLSTYSEAQVWRELAYIEYLKMV